MICLNINKNKKRKVIKNVFNHLDNDDNIDIINHKTSITELIDEACVLAEFGDYNKALQLLIHGNYINPSNHIILEYMAQVYLELGEIYKALKYSKEAIAVSPQWSDGYLTLARAQREYGEIELSLESYKFCLSLNNNNVDALNELREVEEIHDKLQLNRQQLLIDDGNNNSNINNNDEIEVKKCLYHLSSRPGYIAHNDRYY